ncbi:MAG TPA: UDP-N-acetylglucosamine 1-carboxyvinyltransferase [Actinomycetota bacterium]|jgi:UDP-N-acetylglucosamine 1-carboxyvinyltransferase|nr:UDP-N-acetylglucosamine 1-carboxyvinyltransferase [Actinomycetota bacterium]
MSHAYLIEGGRPLHGEVACSGAKNSALKLLAASLLAPGTHTLGRVPDLDDVTGMSEVLRHLGADVTRENGSLGITVPDKLGTEAPYEFVSRMRASTAVLGPLLAREGRARVALPGGCNLGPRRIDLHLKGLEQLGADIRVVHGFIEASCDRLRGAAINLDYPSHGATENLLMAGVLAEGRTVIENASREPEIVDLAQFLERMGAHVRGAGTNVVEIEGVDGLRAASLDVMPDRLEAGTFLLAARATGGDVTVTSIDPSHLEIVLTKLEETGAVIETGTDRVRIQADGRPKATDISTLPYPGFPTDLQPIAVAMLARADGLSIVTENIFDARFFYTDELARMGADVRVEGHYAVVRGTEELLGAPVRAPDIRAGAALVVAGLAADGRTIVEDIIHIDRGHEDLEGKLAGLGADIRRVSAPVPSPA